MKITTKQILKKLFTELNVPKEIIAVKFERSVRTIERWATGETKPKIAERKFLERIYNGYKSRGGAR